jgi:hypothetical protein
MSVKMHKKGEDILANLVWKDTSHWHGNTMKHAVIEFPNQWKLSILRGNAKGIYSDGNTVEIAVICPENDVAYGFGSINVNGRGYGSADVWAWAEPEDVEQLAQWVSTFDVNHPHSDKMPNLFESKEDANEVA